MKSNNQLFSWVDKMPDVMDEHQRIADEKKIEFQHVVMVITGFI